MSTQLYKPVQTHLLVLLFPAMFHRCAVKHSRKKQDDEQTLITFPCLNDI